MAKKFVRGITDIKNIEHQDFDTNNVNDLLSDGQNNYIHRKKGNSEEYHNLTNNIKTIESSNTSLLSVTNYNNSTNSARLTPKHDRRKEQLLESTDETIVISHGENGTDETTSVDVNFDKVQGKLTAGNGIDLLANNTISLKVVEIQSTDNLNNITYTCISQPADNAFNLPSGESGNGLLVTFRASGGVAIQKYHPFTGNKVYIRSCRYLPTNPTWSVWSEGVNKSTIDNLLAQKQNTLTSNTSIGISGTGLRQLYTLKETYSHANATLKTHVKSVANSASISTAEEQFHFLAKMDKGSSSATFSLNEHDTAVFEYLIDTYGEDGSVNISGCAFSLSGSTLTFNCNSATYNPYVVSFSDIISTQSE